MAHDGADEAGSRIYAEEVRISHPPAITAVSGVSVEGSMLSIGTLSIICTWPLWLLFALAPGVTGEEQWVVGNWYVITTASAFASAVFALLGAWIRGTHRAFFLALRYAALTIVVALVLLLAHPENTGRDSGIPGLWFAGFCALPATCLALTVSVRSAFFSTTATVGTTAVINTVVGGHTGVAQFIAYVGYSLLLALYFTQFAAEALQIGRVVDRAEETARRSSIRAARLRARSEEMTKFTALVHDNVLSNLSAIARSEKPEALPDLSLPSQFDNGPEVTSQVFVDVVTRAVTGATPDCEIIVAVAADATPVPTVVASTMTLAVSELARNSVVHAGAVAHRACTIRIGAGEVTVEYRDDGAGFDPAKVRPTAAGLRTSVQGRMDTVDGGGVTIISAPGAGTTVILIWDGSQVHERLDDAGAGASVDSIVKQPDLRGSLSMNRTARHVFAVGHISVFGAMAAADGPLTTPGTLLTLAMIVAAVLLLLYDQSSPLNQRRARLVVTLLVAAVVAGLWQNPDGPEGWLRGWHLAAVSMLAAMLAVTRRPWHALTVVGAGATGLEILRLTGLTPMRSWGITGLSLLSMSLIVVVAVIVTSGLYSFVRRVPVAQDQLRRSLEVEAAVQEAAQQRALNLHMLECAAGPVFSAVNQIDVIPPALATRAHVAELGLRDIIRSPLLTPPALQGAVKDARMRGVTVLLLDDLTGHPGVAGSRPVAEKAVDLLLGHFLGAVDRASSGHVTIRLLPPGRTVFATVTDETGILRFTADGRRIRTTPVTETF